jgi:hypothetical protein
MKFGSICCILIKPMVMMAVFCIFGYHKHVMCADLVITSVGQFDVKLANVRRQKMLL